MDTITIPFASLHPIEGHNYEFDGLTLHESHLKDICAYTGVPASLIGIDKKFGTSTLTQVLSTLETKKINALVEGDEVQILDPRSQVCSDAEFDTYVDLLGSDVEITSTTFGKTATIKTESYNADFLGDLFTKSIKLDKLPQGGLALNMGLLRLACTNGMRVADSQFSHIIRKAVLDGPLAENFKNDVNIFDLDSYFRSIFTNANGEFLPISVTDYIGMKTDLSKITDVETSDLFFPLERIEQCYASQDIDIHKINKGLLNKLPAGLTYYQAFNSLTNAAKRAESLTLADKIKIGAWAKPSRMESLKATDIHYSYIPEFTAQEISARMGDTLL